MLSPSFDASFKAGFLHMAIGMGSFFLPVTCVYGQVLTSYPNQFQAAPITAFNPLTSATFSSNTSSCPMPTFSLSGFAASGDNWANFNNDRSYATTGAGNYGMTASISLPLPGELARQCKENFASYVRSLKLTMSANLVAACATLSHANIDLKSENFQKYFPDMDICQYVVANKKPTEQPNPLVKPLKTPSPHASVRVDEGSFNLDNLRNSPFIFGPQQVPLIQTLPLQAR